MKKMWSGFGKLFVCLFLLSLPACGPKVEKEESVFTPLDQAFENARKDEARRDDFYKTFLISEILVPVKDEPKQVVQPDGVHQSLSPAILEADGKQYLMIFDTEERLAAWAKRKMGFVRLKGRVLAKSMDPAFYWVLNWGTSHMKKFEPEEIRWLKEQV